MHINEKNISLYLDNRLGSKKKRKLEEHFSVCGKCREKLAEWQCLYSSIEQLESDFELDGLEDKIMQKIKNRRPVDYQHEKLRIPVAGLVYFSLVILFLNLLFEPVIDLFGKLYKNTMAFVLHEGIELINTAKWQAVDIIAMSETMEVTGIASCIILIAGGVYFTINRKPARKA